jgi:hypothetical protein
MYTVYVLFIVYVTLPPGISPIAVGINNNNNNNNICGCAVAILSLADPGHEVCFVVCLACGVEYHMTVP